jgi:hypothetical protein
MWIVEAVSHICITLHPIPSEFPYVWGKFSFLFYQCIVSCFPMSKRQSRCTVFREVIYSDLLLFEQNHTFL